MDYRNLLSIGFVILASSLFIDSLQTAKANLPVGMQHGQFPFEHFTECDLPNASGSGGNGCSMSTGVHTIFTVPSDRVFIITGAVSTPSYACYFQNNGQALLSYQFLEGSENRSKSTSPLVMGNAHFKIDAGTNLEIYAATSGCRFYIEGYYAHL